MAELPTPTGREMEILKILWDRGSSSVRGVLDDLCESSDEEIAFNTVQTLLRIMETKQLVEHRVEGRTFIYSPRYSREESASRFLDRVFDGAASELVLSLIKAERVDVDELDRLQKMIANAKKARTKGANA
jgi:BlaI family transcriptional regulator, penicillinase repressor